MRHRILKGSMHWGLRNHLSSMSVCKLLYTLWYLSEALVDVLPHLLALLKIIIYSGLVCRVIIPWEQGWLVPKHTLEQG